MKRYLLFAYPKWEAGGGWHDFEGDFDTIEEAEAHYRKQPEDSCYWNDKFHIVDTVTKEIVRQ